jgi:formylglycine-generating enzyme required for sulfatase activity
VRTLFDGQLGSQLETLDLAGTTLGQRSIKSLVAFHSDRPANSRRVMNALGMELALIPAGRFRMGSTRTEVGHESCEEPRHEVTISRPFYLGVCPVTQGQFGQVMGRNPSFFDEFRSAHPGTPGHPVEQVTWYDAVEFCDRLSAMPQERAARRTYRLPTEAEWEYACRADTTTPFSFGATLTDADANCDATSPYGGARHGRFPDTTTPVGRYPTNPWGLCDMHGNVYEWCADWYMGTYYRRSPKVDPPGPAVGVQRVIRGGSWLIYPRYCRSALRNDWEPDLSNSDANNHMIGFRVVATKNKDEG